MAVKKITYEEALARVKHSLAIRKMSMAQAEKRWASKGLKGRVVFL